MPNQSYLKPTNRKSIMEEQILEEAAKQKAYKLRREQSQILGSPVAARAPTSRRAITFRPPDDTTLVEVTRPETATLAADITIEIGEPMEDLIEELELENCKASFDLHHDAFLFECGLGIAGEVVRMSDRHIRSDVVKDMKKCHHTHHTKGHDPHDEVWSFMLNADPTKGQKVTVTCP